MTHANIAAAALILIRLISIIVLSLPRAHPPEGAGTSRGPAGLPQLSGRPGRHLAGSRLPRPTPMGNPHSTAWISLIRQAETRHLSAMAPASPVHGAWPRRGAAPALWAGAGGSSFLPLSSRPASAGVCCLRRQAR